MSKNVKIQDSIALVTGANRGIGAAFVDALLERGASKVYAGARRLESLRTHQERWGDRVVPVELDVTRPDQVTAAAELAGDVNILVNNAGVANNANVPLVDRAVLDGARHEFEVNVFGLISVTQAFARALSDNGGGAVVNLGSVASLVNFPMFQSYSASKAAVHSITQALRVALPETLTVGVYPGPIDTDMAEDIPFEKTPPSAVANEVLDAVEAGVEDVMPDYMSKEMGAGFFADPKALERQVRVMAEEMAEA